MGRNNSRREPTRVREAVDRIEYPGVWAGLIRAWGTVGRQTVTHRHFFQGTERQDVGVHSGLGRGAENRLDKRAVDHGAEANTQYRSHAF